LTDLILTPGVIWTKPPSHRAGLSDLIYQACRHIQPSRILIVFDQFEEFVILKSEAQRDSFVSLLTSLQEHPIRGVSILLVLRTDYLDIAINELHLPKRVEDHNWKDIPPFKDAAAYAFLQSGFDRIDESLLTNVLREASEIEKTVGLIRPITANLCGLVLSRFRTGLPSRFRPGRLIRGFLQEAVTLPEIREVAPKIIPQLLSDHLTKIPKTLTQLATATRLPETEVERCLTILSMSERGIVRPLDQDKKTWEISHDFLAPLLDAILARWSVSLWRRVRPAVPWITMVVMLVFLGLALAGPLIRPRAPDRNSQEWLQRQIKDANDRINQFDVEISEVQQELEHATGSEKTSLQMRLKELQDSSGDKLKEKESVQATLDIISKLKTRVNPADGLTYVFILSGDFLMGCSFGDNHCDTRLEKPPRPATIADGFWLGQTEVSQAAWKKVNGNSNPSYFKGDQLPVENVTWAEAQNYCKKTVDGRLPTEEQWEYAARAGTTTALYGDLGAVAWYSGDSNEQTHPIGFKQVNKFGLFDMLGNVWEWTQDDYNSNNKVARGGSWVDNAGVVRASVRAPNEPLQRRNYIGFRCVGKFQ